MTDWDEESLLIFPTRWKKDRNKTYAKCKLCGREFEEKHLREGICRDCREHFQKCKLCGKIFDEAQLEEGICQSCLNKGEHYRCERCGREMIYTNRRKYIEKIPRPSICRKHFKTCKICGKEFDEKSLTRCICRECLNKGEKYRCERCGREMIYTNRQKYINKVERPRICNECKEGFKKRTWVRTCNKCGRTFEITSDEAEYCKAKGLSSPTRCKDCRNKK